MNEKLKKAVEIFKKYGWLNVTAENILELPIGTPEEKKIALNGLKNGDWFLETDFEAKLGLYAIRCGVTAVRASNILDLDHADEEALIKLLEHRGKKYASELLARLNWDLHRHPRIITRIINDMDLPVPKNREYLRDWSLIVAILLNNKRPFHAHDKREITLDIFKKRFAEHVRTGAEIGYLGFAHVTAEGAKQGLICRKEAIELVFSALDSAVRSGDRAAWVSALDKLEIPDNEYIQRIQFLIPVLSTGNNAVVTKISPILIKHADAEFLTEVLIASFSCKTQKAKKMILKAASQREKPPNAQAIAPWLSLFAEERDKTISSLSERLIKKWEIETEKFEEFEEETVIMGLWKETPPVWEVRDFEVGEVSPEIIAELAEKIGIRESAEWYESVQDIFVERLLAAINIVALKNIQTARDALCGLNITSGRFIRSIAHWAKGTFDSDDIGIIMGMNKVLFQPHLLGRNYIVTQNFGKIPCILSTPSKLDLTITVSDLISRLNLYEKEKTDVLEADLSLALTRLDVKTKKPEHTEQLKNIKIAIRLSSGKHVKNETEILTAAQVVKDYLESPLTQPEMFLEEDEYKFNNVKTVKAFDCFPDRFSDKYSYQDFSTFPCMNDDFLYCILWKTNRIKREMGLVMRQAARRGVPFSPAFAINFLALMRLLPPEAIQDATLAIQEAFERGLLRPKTPDIKYLDWTTKPPSDLAALVSSLENIARDGILSIVWYVLDDLIGASLAAPKMFASTAKITEAILSFLPEVQFAVKNKIAPASALDLPNTRELAKRKGTSQAIGIAKKIAELIPQIGDKK